MEFIDDWYRTAKDVLFDSGYFFRTMPTSGGFGEPLRFALVNMFIMFVLDCVFSAQLGLFTLIVAPVALIFGTIGLFLAAGVYHILLRIVGARKNFEATFRVFAYLSVFNIFMSIISINNIIAYVIAVVIALYVFRIMIIALKVVHEISFMRCAIVILVPVIILVMATISAAAIAYFWISSFTQEHAEMNQNFDEKVGCAYSNIELDRDLAKYDSSNKVFYGFVSNTGVDAVTITKVEVWTDQGKQLPIKLNTNNRNLTTIDKNGHLEFYVDLSSAFPGGGLGLIKIKFVTECEPVFDSIARPREGWNVFDWDTSGGALANE